jgi:lipopolysaccharide export system permease protein
MIPLIWRYLLKGYFKVFFLSVCTFVSILIVSRFKEIARFAALCDDFVQTAVFLLYQIPFILPLAIPISSLLASFLLFHRLSLTYELNALRSCGMSFRRIVTPVLFLSSLLSLLNFCFCAELSPFCRREAKALLYQATSNNPLLLLQRQGLIKIKGAYLNMNIKKEGKSADDLILIVPNEKNGHLTLFSAHQLRISKEKLLGYQVAALSYLSPKKIEEGETLILENQKMFSTDAPILSAALKKNRPKLEPNILNLKMLQIHMHQAGKKAQKAKLEIIRRLSLSFSVFTFTLLGCTFGIQQGRSQSKKGAFVPLLLVIFLLMSYLGIKELKSSTYLAIFVAAIPHLLIFFFSLRRIFSISRGSFG